jgi:hypothetical protein
MGEMLAECQPQCYRKTSPGPVFGQVSQQQTKLRLGIVRADVGAFGLKPTQSRLRRVKS